MTPRYHRYEDAGITLRVLIWEGDDRVDAWLWFSDPEIAMRDPRAASWIEEIISPLRTIETPVLIRSEGPGYFNQYLLIPKPGS